MIVIILSGSVKISQSVDMKKIRSNLWIAVVTICLIFNYQVYTKVFHYVIRYPRSIDQINWRVENAAFYTTILFILFYITVSNLSKVASLNDENRAELTIR